jgi:hypothetical protein
VVHLVEEEYLLPVRGPVEWRVLPYHPVRSDRLAEAFGLDAFRSGGVAAAGR